MALNSYRTTSKVLGILLLTLLTYSCGQKRERDEKHKYTNALIDETSPYLLQHAHNPVDWRPWSQEALEEAKKQNKLVLVSIGYSSCHWCHVMEEETFEDEEIAKMMNENFINIKVDREERPDVDQVYMTALQLLKGDGGWPLNVITLPNGKPIYGGTYHTKQQWGKVLTEVSTMYEKDPQRANEYANMVAQGIQEANLIQPSMDFDKLTKNELKKNVELWKTKWDTKWGGNKGSQKFMLPSNMDFLLDYAALAKDESAKVFVNNTLDKMANGGIYDHVGGGFFRYSTDSKWKIPHFEKMLYDNAQLISLYSTAYKVFQDAVYKDLVLETIAFLQREMKNSEGGYYAAMDADSEGEEGKYYLWKEDELKSVLGDDFKLFSEYYNVDGSSSWENGNYVLHTTTNDKIFAEKHNLTMIGLDAVKNRWKSTLLKERQNRVRPRLDDKIITSWNALLINAYVDAYETFGDMAYLEEAEEIFFFIKKNSFKNNRLVHSYKENSKHIEGFLEDYAFLANASLNLYSATMDTDYLVFAKNLTKTVEEDFSDKSSGMFRYKADNELISTIIKTDDGVLPSPNAVMAHNLFRLGHIEYNTDYIDKSKTMLSSMLPNLREYPSSYAKWNSLFLHMAYPFYEIAIVGPSAKTLTRELQEKHIPNTMIVGSLGKSDLPLFKSRFVKGDTFIYVCQNSSCKLPVTTTEEAIGQLERF